LGAHTLTPFKVLKLLVLNHRGSCLKKKFILNFFCDVWQLFQIFWLNVFQYILKHIQFVILKIVLCMAINLSKIKLINYRILVKSKFCLFTSSKTP
jgi:hypothetical protein